jgi:putative membrane protein
MITDIAKLYGYKPNFIGELMLVKSVIFNLAFASVTELLTHHSGDMFGGTMLSKLSLHGAQGVANGVLIARVGLGTIKSVRPIIYKDKNEGFLKNLTKNIINKIFSNKSTN